LRGRQKKINQRFYCYNYIFLYQIIFLVGMNPVLLSALSAESNKKNDSLRALRLCGENKKEK